MGFAVFLFGLITHNLLAFLLMLWSWVVELSYNASLTIYIAISLITSFFISKLLRSNYDTGAYTVLWVGIWVASIIVVGVLKW